MLPEPRLVLKEVQVAFVSAGLNCNTYAGPTSVQKLRLKSVPFQAVPPIDGAAAKVSVTGGALVTEFRGSLTTTAYGPLKLMGWTLVSVKTRAVAPGKFVP